MSVKNIPELLGGFVVRFRIPIIIATIIAVGLFTIAVFSFQFENDLTYWVDKDSSIGALPHYISEKFGGNSPLLIAIKTDDVFSSDSLLRLKTLCDRLRELPEVKSTYALPTVDEVTPTPGGVLVEKLIPDPLPATPEAFGALRERVLSGAAYTGRLVSADGKTTLVAVSLYFGKADKTAAVIRSLAEQVFAGSGAELHFSGNTFILNSMSGIVLGDFSFLIPLVTVLVLGVLFLSFRTVRGVALPLVTVIISTVLAMGIMAALGIPLNIMSSAVPVILIAVGSAYGIHILNHYYEYTRSHAVPDKKEMTASLIRYVGLPVLMAGLTTMAGFISNVTAEVSIIRTFGVFTAVGVGLAVVISLLFIPAVLSLLPFPRRRLVVPTGADAAARAHPTAEKLATFILRFRGAIIAGFAGVAVLSGFFALRVTPKVDILGYFAENSEPRVASRFINDNFGGFNPLSIYLKGDAADPDVLKTLLVLEERIKASGRLNPPSGLPDVVAELNHAFTGFATIPETKPEVENLLFFIEGKSMTDGMVTKDRQETLVTVLLPSMDNVYLEKLFADTEAYLSGFRGGIAMAENDPGSPAFRAVAAPFLAALLSDERIPYTDESLAAAVARLSDKAAAFHPAPDLSRAAAYAVSDEAEIILEDDEAKQLVRELAAAGTLDLEKSKAAVRRSLGAGADVTDEETAAFAKSILQALAESGDTRKLEFLTAALIEEFPGVKSARTARVNRALSCFFWKTIPVPRPATIANGNTAVSSAISTGFRPVRTTPVARLEMTGTAKLVEDIRGNTFSNQLTSILIALVTVFVLNALTFRSAGEGLISLTAIIFTIVVNFGVMGLAGIPLDFVTAIIAGVAIGTGIDYTIHFISRFTREVKDGNNQHDALAATLAGTGKAILFNALCVALGFAVLLFSNVVPMRSTGILLASTMATSALAALTLMPALLAVTRLTERIIRRHARTVRPARTPKSAVAAAPVNEPSAGGGGSD